MSDSPFTRYSKYPNTKDDLILSEGQLVNKRTKAPLLTIDGLPWLLNNPDLSLAKWRQQLRQFVDAHLIEIQKLENTKAALPSTRKRMDKTLEALRYNHAAFEALLSPILQMDGKYPEHLNLQFDLPKVHAYFQNIFRDWHWDTDENQKHLDFVVDSLGDVKFDRLFVFGAGAGRLSYDLHRRLQLTETIVSDINPLLALVADRSFQGTPLGLYDVPDAPLNLEQVAYRSQPTSIAKVDGLHTALCDISDNAFRSEKLQTILTPWLIDVVNHPLETLLFQCHRLLEKGGYWVNFGPLGYSDRYSTQSYRSEEIKELAEQFGFKLVASKQAILPYMQSPVTQSGRTEPVQCLVFEKCSDHQFRWREHQPPIWITNIDEPIQLTSALQQKLEVAKTQYEILAAVDGKISINELAQMMAEHYQMSEDDAVESLLSFLG